MRSAPPGPIPYERLHAPAAGGPLPPELEETLDLTRYLAALRRRWFLIAACVVIAALFALARYKLTTKEYQATAVIQIERKQLSLLALGQAGWLENWWNLEYYPTQYRLLRSRVMAERVVQHLRLWEHPELAPREANPVFSDGAGAADAAGTSEAQLARLAGRIRAGLEVKPIRDTQLVDLVYRSTSPELAARIANAYAEVFIAWGIEDRTATAGQASSFLSSQIETLRHEIEERQKLLNAFTSSSEFALDPAGEALLERRQTLEQQYNRVVGERIRKEAAYREVLNLPPETVANASSEGQVSELRSELFLLESDYKSKLDTFTPEWPVMVELQKSIGEKRDQLERLIQEAYQEAKDRSYAEFQRARREETSLEEELRKLSADVRLQNSTALEYNNMVTYIDTRKELLEELLKRQSETEVQTRLQTTTGSNVRIVDRAVVPGAHFRPSLERSLPAAILLGLALGVAGVLLLEFMDRTVKSPEELEAIFGLPTLTVIPDISRGRGSGGRYGYRQGAYGYGYGYGDGDGDGNGESTSEGRPKGRPAAGGWAGRGRTPGGQTPGDRTPEGRADGSETRIELVPHRRPRLAVSEAYRSLRTALLLSSAGDLKIVAITSAEPGEGKTVTTCNLAVVMAQLGRRVLVLDADLRRPRMHRIFETSNRLGLVSHLTGKIGLDEICFPTGIDHLSVCPAGPIPPNPSELLASDRMQELLSRVRSRFDFVAVDTPPALPVADAVILGAHIDGMVVCARTGVLLREDAKACRDRLRYADLKIFGLVLNRYRDGAGRYGKRYRYYDAYEEPEPADKSPSAA